MKLRLQVNTPYDAIIEHHLDDVIAEHGHPDNTLKSGRAMGRHFVTPTVE